MSKGRNGLTYFVLGMTTVTAGCGRHSVHKMDTPSDVPGQWVLESYREDTGYTFRKDGVTYVTRCDGVNYGRGKGAEPVKGEFECSPILAYLHKSVPSLRLGFPDQNGTILPESTSALYYDDEGRQYLFFIVEAK